jgi:serine/tyrosine/threonine adenylyltransferase
MTGLLDIDPRELRREDLAEYFGGNKLLPGSEPYAHCYCGHQFGAFSGQVPPRAAHIIVNIIMMIAGAGEEGEKGGKAGGGCSWPVHHDLSL